MSLFENVIEATRKYCADCSAEYIVAENKDLRTLLREYDYIDGRGLTLKGRSFFSTICDEIQALPDLGAELTKLKELCDAAEEGRPIQRPEFAADLNPI